MYFVRMNSAWLETGSSGIPSNCQILSASINSWWWISTAQNTWRELSCTVWRWFLEWVLKCWDSWRERLLLRFWIPIWCLDFLRSSTTSHFFGKLKREVYEDYNLSTMTTLTVGRSTPTQVSIQCRLRCFQLRQRKLQRTSLPQKTCFLTWLLVLKKENLRCHRM